MAETVFGPTITLSTGRIVPVRWIGEQHVLEDLGRIPSFADWARAVRPEQWMGRTQNIDEITEVKGKPDASTINQPWAQAATAMQLPGMQRPSDDGVIGG